MTDPETTEAEQDLVLAAELQAALLPIKCPTDCTGHAVSARNRMCGKVGGDFYDFISINKEQMALLIGDVLGHGVRASLIMANIMGWLRSEPHRYSRPRDVLGGLNNLLLDLGDKTGSVMTCSMFYAVVDLPTGIGFFINAGHPPPFLCIGGACTRLDSGPRSTILGIEEFEPKEGCHTFLSGHRMVMFTDGITEAANPQGQRFESHRLEQLVCHCAGMTPDKLTEAAFNAVDEFCLDAVRDDDETIVVIDRV